MNMMKWFIYNCEFNEPLCWEGKVLEFDTEEQAKVFLSSIPPVGYEHITDTNIEIKNCILYYDGGHLNASGKILIYDENGEEILANMEEE